MSQLFRCGSSSVSPFADRISMRWALLRPTRHKLRLTRFSPRNPPYYLYERCQAGADQNSTRMPSAARSVPRYAIEQQGIEFQLVGCFRLYFLMPASKFPACAKSLIESIAPAQLAGEMQGKV